jgi:phosphatidylglycerol---prolipoprotein diacylglyceryl transferase
VFPLINVTPDPVLIQLGPIAIGWYGIGYVVAIGVLLWVTQREAERRGFERAHVWNAFVIVFVLALVGGRLYHVIDQWDEIYSLDPLRAILPIQPGGAIGFSGLGVFGGIAGAAIGILIYARWKKIPLALGLDMVIPGTLLAQGIARWGNFFNQELYGPPTDAPWGIAIECQYRVPQYPCTTFPFETTGFHPLFFYESALDITGGLIALWLSRRFLQRLQPGDLAAFWGIWYGSVRTALETLREGWNWTVGGIPTAQLIGIAVIVIGVAWLVWNHRPGKEPYPYLAPIVPEQHVDPFDEDEEDAFDDEDADDFVDEVGDDDEGGPELDDDSDAPVILDDEERRH